MRWPGPGLELVRLLDEWEVMGLGDDTLEGGIECGACGKELSKKKLLYRRNLPYGLGNWDTCHKFR